LIGWLVMKRRILCGYLTISILNIVIEYPNGFLVYELINRKSRGLNINHFCLGMA